jgi:hypothetical protein
MLDLDEIFAAAGLIDGKQETACFPHGKQPCFPVQTQQQSGLPGIFEAWETRETGFRGGSGETLDLHTDFAKDEPLSPVPPDTSLKRGKPEKPNITVSLVSRERETQYQPGLAGDFCGKQPCFPLFPVFPAIADDLEAREERAAIMEHDGDMTRAEAEAAAGLGSCQMVRFFLELPNQGNPNRVEFLECNTQAHATTRLTQ